MEIVVRQYSGKKAKQLFDLLAQKEEEVAEVMKSIDGIVSYTLARTDKGGLSVTIGKNREAIDASTRKAREWVEQNAGHLGVEAPAVWPASIIMHLNS